MKIWRYTELDNITSPATYTLKPFRYIITWKPDGKTPELEYKFIEYFEETKFKIQRISAEIVTDFTKSWSTEEFFEAGPLESFPFWSDWSWYGVSNDAILHKGPFLVSFTEDMRL